MTFVAIENIFRYLFLLYAVNRLLTPLICLEHSYTGKHCWRACYDLFYFLDCRTIQSILKK